MGWTQTKSLIFGTKLLLGGWRLLCGAWAVMDSALSGKHGPWLTLGRLSKSAKLWGFGNFVLISQLLVASVSWALSSALSQTNLTFYSLSLLQANNGISWLLQVPRQFLANTCNRKAALWILVFGMFAGIWGLFSCFSFCFVFIRKERIFYSTKVKRPSS